MTPKSRLTKLEKQPGQDDNVRIIVRWDEATKEVVSTAQKLPGKGDGGIHVSIVDSRDEA